MRTKESLLLTGFVLYGINDKNRFTPIGVVSKDGSRKAKCDLNVIPNTFIWKLIQVEDIRFYNHFGLDIKAIARAIIMNIKARKIVQGGSTITQQLARNLFQDNRVTIFRKLKEMLYALYLELRYSKDRIVELYLNSIFWGKNIYGIRSASLYYLGKEVDRLSSSDETFLLTLLRGPNYYLKYRDALEKRYSLLNRKLFQSKVLTKKNFKRTLNKSLRFQENNIEVFRAESIPFIANSIDSKSFSVYTTLNKKLQNKLSSDIQRQKIPLSVVVIVDGKVKAVSSTHGTNHPFLYRSNVGSTLKPFIYTILRRLGFGKDVEIPLANQNAYKWTIGEATSNEFVKLTLDKALLLSNNNAFVNASIKIGIDNVLSEIAKFMPFQNSLTPSIILGASSKGISLYELTLMYNNFFYKNSDDIMIECREILNKTLNRRLNLQIDAGYLKTGTTNDFRQRFAMFGMGSTTVGFLTEGFRDVEEDDYEKDEDYLFVVKSFINTILKIL